MPPNVNFGPPKIYETTRARKLKLKMPLNSKVLASGTKNFSARGVQVHRAPNLNFGPPNISETTRVRKLKLKLQLDMVQ